VDPSRKPGNSSGVGSGVSDALAHATTPNGLVENCTTTPGSNVLDLLVVRLGLLGPGSSNCFKKTPVPAFLCAEDVLEKGSLKR
jgi:hypothetical protein